MADTMADPPPTSFTDKLLVAFVSTPGALAVPLLAIVLAGMLYHFNENMLFSVFK